MNISLLKKHAVSLEEHMKDLTKEERKIIEAEKKYYDIVVALRKQREKLGFTQEKLADISKLPRTTITKVESGSRNATLQTLISMAEAMGKTVELKLWG